jgi:hypothetical protein
MLALCPRLARSLAACFGKLPARRRVDLPEPRFYREATGCLAFQASEAW